MSKKLTFTARLLLIIALIFAALPMGSVRSVQAADNLIANGGFESGAASWQGIKISQVATWDFHTGKISAQFIADGEITQGPIKVTPGKTYTLTAWYKWMSFQGTDWGYDRMRIVDTSWHTIGEVKKMHSSTARDTWKKFTIVFTAKTDKVMVSMGEFGPQTSINFFFDDISLQEGNSPAPTDTPTPAPTTKPTGMPTAKPTAVPPTAPTATQVVAPTFTPAVPPTSTPVVPTTSTPTTAPTPTNGELVQNGDFESGISTWQNMKDTQWANWDFHAGQRSAQFIADGEITQGPIAVTPGTSYTLTAWYKWMSFSGTDWGYDRMRVVDASWNTLAEVNKMHASVPRDTWQKLSVTFTPQSSQVLVSFGEFGPQTSINFFFDDVSLTESGSTPSGQPPTVAVAASATEGNPPLEVIFAASASDPDGVIMRYQWDFGDGSTDTAQNPAHTFQSAGKFMTKCTVWDNSNLTASASWTVTVGGASGSGPAPTGNSSVKITSPSSSGTFSTSDSAVVLQGTSDNAASVSWDNLNTDNAGVITGSAMNSWQTPSIPLKAGRNEILITAMNSDGAPATAHLMVTRQVSGPAISNIKLSSNSVAKFDEERITFDLRTVAEDYLFRYDTNPPPGVKAGIGVTVEGVFTSPSGKQLVQPGFYMTDVTHSGTSGFGHYEQTNHSYWSVRFSPQETGNYSVSIRVKDASGSTEASAGSFSAGSPSKPGYVKVSKSDTRYFEFSNGTLFWPNGPADGPGYSQYAGTGMNMQRQWMAGLGVLQHELRPLDVVQQEPRQRRL